MILSFDHSNDQLLKFWLMPVQITVFLSKKKTSIPLYQIDMTYIYSWFIESGDWKIERQEQKSLFMNRGCKTPIDGFVGLDLPEFSDFWSFALAQNVNSMRVRQRKETIIANCLHIDFSFLECGKREGRSYNYINTLRTQINTSDIQRVLCKRVKKVFSSY